MTRALNTAVDAFYDAGWSTDDKNMRAAVRAYLDHPDTARLIQQAINNPGRYDQRSSASLSEWQARAVLRAILPEEPS